MRIGLGQIDIVWENKKENMSKCEYYVRLASDNNVAIIVFPEMTLTGFSMNVERTSENNNSITVDFFKILAKKYDIAIVFGYVSEESEKYYNKLVFVDKTGIIMDYSKIHPFSYGEESKYFSAGSKIEHGKFMNINFGGYICYDLRFPEIFQASSIDNEVIFVIANWPKARVKHWRTLLSARAIENQCYIIGVNRVGIGNNLEYEGSSMIIDPYGECITNTVAEEGLIIGNINIETVHTYRREFPQILDKKVDLYKTFY